MVLVTAPDIDTARRIASAILTERLAACANLVPGIESHYWWEGKLESSGEVLMVLKTTRDALESLERCVLAGHPYQVPEFVVLPITNGSSTYLDWLRTEVHSSPPRETVKSSSVDSKNRNQLI